MQKMRQGDSSRPFYFSKMLYMTHPATGRRADVVQVSLCTSQWHRKYVSNETPHNVSVKCHQGVSVVRLHDNLLEFRDVSTRRNDDVPLVRLHDVSR